MKIFGVSVVRDEADIIGTTIRYHLALGLDRILVIDNGSSDGTDEVLQELAKDQRVQWTREEGPCCQAEMTTQLAREACAAGASWIVPFDADEFWYAPCRQFRQVLENSSAGALRAQVIHYIQSREQLESTPECLLTMTRRAPRMIGPPDQCYALVESRQIAQIEVMYSPKWVSRASRDLIIEQGNHWASNFPGEAETTADLVCMHAPLRSRAVLRRKSEHCAGLQGWHIDRLRRLRETGQLDVDWAANSYKEDSLELQATRRPVVFDPALRDLVAPFVGCGHDSASARATADSSRAAEERAAWAHEATQMFLNGLHEDSLAHTKWGYELARELDRTRALVADLKAQVAERTAWAEIADREAEVARLARAESHAELERRAAWGRELELEVSRLRTLITRLQAQLAERTCWAQTRDADVAQRDATIADLQAQLAERTGWATSADREVERARAALAALQQEFQERTAWALSLDEELSELRRTMSLLDRELAQS